MMPSPTSIDSPSSFRTSTRSAAIVAEEITLKAQLLAEHPKLSRPIATREE